MFVFCLFSLSVSWSSCSSPDRVVLEQTEPEECLESLESRWAQEVGFVLVKKSFCLSSSSSEESPLTRLSFSLSQGDRGFDGLPGLPGDKGHRVSEWTSWCRHGNITSSSDRAESGYWRPLWTFVSSGRLRTHGTTRIPGRGRREGEETCTELINNKVKQTIMINVSWAPWPWGPWPWGPWSRHTNTDTRLHTLWLVLRTLGRHLLSNILRSLTCLFAVLRETTETLDPGVCQVNQWVFSSSPAFISSSSCWAFSTCHSK